MPTNAGQIAATAARDDQGIDPWDLKPDQQKAPPEEPHDVRKLRRKKADRRARISKDSETWDERC